jgi:hypothetical protein
VFALIIYQTVINSVYSLYLIIDSDETPDSCAQHAALFDDPAHPWQYLTRYLEAENVDTKNVKLRGVHIKSTAADSPNLIFFPEVFDQAESWLDFFSNPLNKVAFTGFRSYNKEMFTSSTHATSVTPTGLTASTGRTSRVVSWGFR